MNKKTRKAALCAALAHRSEGESLRVIESFELTEIKTKKIVSLLGALDVTSALFVVDAGNINLQKSAKNIPGVKTIAVEGLNVYDILKYDYLLCTPTTANSIVERLSN
jgi:large subunit ribosomal protein L4